MNPTYNVLAAVLSLPPALSPLHGAILAAATTPQTLSQLSARIPRALPNVCAALKALEAAGYVQRHDGNRRFVIIQTTPMGKKLLDEQFTQPMGLVNAVLDNDSPDTVRELLVGARISFLRDSKGLSQNQLSQKSGIPQYILSKIELEGEITLDNLVKISEALGVNPIELLEKSKTE